MLNGVRPAEVNSLVVTASTVKAAKARDRRVPGRQRMDVAALG